MSADASHAETDAPNAGRAPADMVLKGGVIHTLDPRESVVSALAATGGEIVALGGDAAIEGLIGPETTVIDLGGRAVLPGINDAHLHGVWMGAKWPEMMFGGSREGWDIRLLSSEDDRRAAIRKTFELLASFGVTSFTEPGLGPGEDDGVTGCFGSNTLESYAALAGTEAQTARVTALRLFGILDGASHFADVRKGLDVPLPEADPRWLNVTGIKIFGDGIPPMRNAWIRSAYRDNGGHGGLMTGDGDEEARLAEFRDMITYAHERGLQIGVHATGDRTIEEFIAQVERLGGAGDLRHYVIHGDLIDADQLRRLEAIGMGIALQPLIGDFTGDWLRSAVTDEVADAAWPLHLMLGDGLRAILSSDAPVASPDWRQITASAARRLEAQGVILDKAVTTRLLRMYTAIPAEQDFAEGWKGTLETGKVADLCIVDADPYTIGPKNFGDLNIDLTMVDGRVVFEREGVSLAARRGITA